MIIAHILLLALTVLAIVLLIVAREVDWYKIGRHLDLVAFISILLIVALGAAISFITLFM